MDFEILTSNLVGALSHVAPITQGKTTMPILASVLVEAEKTPDGGRLTVSAYDLEVGMVVTVPAEVKKPGALALPAKMLLHVAKNLPASKARIAQAAAQRVEITSADASFRLVGHNADDFPRVPEADVGDYHSTESLHGALDAVAFAMSADETRYALNGVLFDLAGDRLVATDGHRLASHGIDGHNRKASAIVSRKAVATLQRLLATEGENRGELALTESSLLYRRPDLRVTARLVDGQFPDYTQVIPDRSPSPVTIAVAPLRESLRRVLLVGGDAAVSLQLGDGTMRVTARHAEIGDATDTVTVEGVGNVSVSVKGRYLLEMLDVTGADAIAMHLTGDTDPILVEPLGAGPTYVLMPMRA